MIRDEQIFSRGRVRRTVQRQMILQVLEEADRHLTIEQLAERVQAISPSVSLSTIYRNVDLLSALGLLRANRLLGEGTTYERADDQSHIHLVCLGCHRVIHQDAAPLDLLQARLQVLPEFHAVSLAVTAAGYCSTCWDRLSAQEQGRRDPE
jgi:Fe2+ or Zn2+ uptake regulation protein